MITPFSERRRSVFDGDDASEFCDWLAKRLHELPPDRKPVMVATPITDDPSGGVMVGIRWLTNGESAPTDKAER